VQFINIAQNLDKNAVSVGFWFCLGFGFCLSGCFFCVCVLSLLAVAFQVSAIVLPKMFW